MYFSYRRAKRPHNYTSHGFALMCKGGDNAMTFPRYRDSTGTLQGTTWIAAAGLAKRIVNQLKGRPVRVSKLAFQRCETMRLSDGYKDTLSEQLYPIVKRPKPVAQPGLEFVKKKVGN